MSPKEARPSVPVWRAKRPKLCGKAPKSNVASWLAFWYPWRSESEPYEASSATAVWFLPLRDLKYPRSSLRTRLPFRRCHRRCHPGHACWRRLCEFILTSILILLTPYVPCVFRDIVCVRLRRRTGSSGASGRRHGDELLPTTMLPGRRRGLPAKLVRRASSAAALATSSELSVQCYYELRVDRGGESQ